MISPNAYTQLEIQNYKPTILTWHNNNETASLFACAFLEKYFDRGPVWTGGRLVRVKASLAYIYDRIKTYHNIHTDWEVRTKRVQATLYEIYVTDDLGDSIESMYAVCDNNSEFIEAAMSLLEPYVLKSFGECETQIQR